jgi:hypothetical protein
MEMRLQDPLDGGGAAQRNFSPVRISIMLETLEFGSGPSFLRIPALILYRRGELHGRKWHINTFESKIKL